MFDELDDVVRTTAEGVLGLTVGCARCHDHKLDPIPQADYYKMVAVFRDLTPFRHPRPPQREQPGRRDPAGG